jgi:5-methylcytosine-specific restriction endonuclease McrA
MTNDPVNPSREDVVRQVKTRDEVARLLAEGMSKLEIARTLGIARGTVSYHARRLGHPVDERGARRYDWAAIQAFYDHGHGVAECVERFGFSRYSWNEAVRRGAIVPRPKELPIVDLCQAATPRGRHNLKRRLVAAGLKAPQCELCGLAEWRGHPLMLALHHVNGDRHDNRLENLQLLCPNCHSQTENFGARNRRAA